MNAVKKLNVHFYESLGKLFYAIAAADRKVRPEEFNKLKEIVKSQWLDVDPIEDNFGTDSAYQIEIVFDWLNNQNGLNSEACFNEFIAYKNKQNHFFTDATKRLILKTAAVIASSFSGVNKSELIMLTKLTIELKKIKPEL